MFRKTTIIFKGLAAGLLILSLAGWSFATTSYVPTRQVLEVGWTRTAWRGPGDRTNLAQTE